MTGQSKVGTSGVYEAGDQRNVKQSEAHEATRYHEGQEHSHLANDSKDQRSIANRLDHEERRSHEDDKPNPSQLDPTLPARLHGNKPSRGAEIDAELLAEEKEYLERKGKA
ncbi:hypothetical protein BX600DRAFT_465632 [Xylariales sp. PMI_506]|nr:hypothetical protein BX600DRAFT_465632 [Xylariales sp. PMI_506]